MDAKEEEIITALIKQKIHDLHRGFFIFIWLVYYENSPDYQQSYMEA